MIPTQPDPHIVQCRLLDEGQDIVDPAAGLTAVVAAVGIALPTPNPAARGQKAPRLFVGEAAERQLFQVVLALHLPRGLAGRLHRRQQQGNQDPDDRDHNQEFHQGKTARRRRGRTVHRTSRRIGVGHPSFLSARLVPVIGGTVCNPYGPGRSKLIVFEPGFTSAVRVVVSWREYFSGTSHSVTTWPEPRPTP